MSQDRISGAFWIFLDNYFLQLEGGHSSSKYVHAYPTRIRGYKISFFFENFACVVDEWPQIGIRKYFKTLPF